MSDDYDHGPLRTYEVTWTTGHVEKVQGHSVVIPFVSSFMSYGVPAREDFITIHGEFDGKWRLVLAVHPSRISAVRDVTDGEPVPAQEGVHDEVPQEG